MDSLVGRILEELRKIPLIDPHSHVDPRSPVATSLNDLLAYHYYTELAHSAGLPKFEIESTHGFEQAERIVEYLTRCSNTVQYSWLVELIGDCFGFDAAELTPKTLPDLFIAAERVLAAPDWRDTVFRAARLDSIFLTNDFDDSLRGFDTRRFVPCLRTDELVFKLTNAPVRRRLAESTGIEVVDWVSVGRALDRCFERFVNHGARACAVSLPPDFAPVRPGPAETDAALVRLLRGTQSADDQQVLAYAVFFALADRCEEFSLPFDLMLGVQRNVYEFGVYQGQDLFDQTTSLYQYRRLFNEKRAVTFPVSVLTHSQNQELVAYAWIFPNVLTSGHWWYSNVPAYIECDLRARLEAVPRSKQIGYYSDAYKLEFVLPKYNMYRRVLANVLARAFVIARRWSETRAIELGRCILRDNVERVFPARDQRQIG